MLILVRTRRILEWRHRFGGEAGKAAEVGGVGDAEMRVAEGASVAGESLGRDRAVGEREAGVSSEFYKQGRQLLLVELVVEGVRGTGVGGGEVAFATEAAEGAGGEAGENRPATLCDSVRRTCRCRGRRSVPWRSPIRPVMRARPTYEAPVPALESYASRYVIDASPSMSPVNSCVTVACASIGMPVASSYGRSSQFMTLNEPVNRSIAPSSRLSKPLAVAVSRVPSAASRVF